MAGHMGNRRRTSLNLLVVYSDPDRQLIFVQGAVPGPRNGTVIIAQGRRNPLSDYAPPVFNFDQLVEGDIESDLPSDEIDQVEESVVTEADDVVLEDTIEESVVTEADDVVLEDTIEESSNPSIKEDSV